MKAVLDTNVLVSGIFWKGESHKVVLAWREGKYTLVTSREIMAEMERVLREFKIRLPEELVQEWSKMILHNALLVEPRERLDVVKDDPSDNKFVEAAVAARADCVVSQDKHLLKMKSYRDIRVVTPDLFNREMMKE